MLDSNSSLDVAHNDKLFTLAYEELRRLASSVRRSGRGHTLSPTALVNEAWIKMAGSAEGRFENTLHFKRVAARAMRQVLVDTARRKVAQRRGGQEAACFVTFDEEVCGDASSPLGLIALNEALEKLAGKNARQAEIAVLRIFQGMEMGEIASALNISEITVHRDWRVIRAWLGV